jgi:mono/diheme cytochrome c family protein
VYPHEFEVTHVSSVRVAVLALLAPILLGCDALGDQHTQPPPMRSMVPPPSIGTPIQPTSADEPIASSVPAAPMMLIPVDEREAVSAAGGTLPISGGTLLLSPKGDVAIAADPERDRVSIVNVFFEQLAHNVELSPGDEPTRLVMDGVGLVHVVLRGSAQIATIDPGTGELRARRGVCRAPRGIAYDAAGDVLHVACETGELWTLPAAGGEPVRKLSLPNGLRDVLVDGDHLWVSRFKSAELLRLDADGRVTATLRPDVTRTNRVLAATEVMMPRFAPNGAFRIALSDAGSVVMLHQRALVDAIKLDPSMPSSANGYYGGDCGGIVESTVTVFMPDGTTSTSGALPGTLAVDLSVGAAGAVVAFAGGTDVAAPRAGFRTASNAAGVVVMALAQPPALSSSPTMSTTEVVVGCATGKSQATAGQIVAVAQRSDGEVIVAQSREPAQLEILKKPGGSSQSIIAFGGPSALDTGHELFHRSPSGGVTCASCHLEGAEDGHVWTFDPLGPRRTQAVNVGLAGTEPFHWAGDLPDLQALLAEVMVVRMGGMHQSPARVEALADFMFGLHAPPPSVSADDAAAVRGKALFESPEVGCAECHAGAGIKSRESHDVGTGETLQVPSLRSIEYRAPFMHDGCAPTLRARFDLACGGGDQHGHTSQLSAAELDDLVAYQRSL